VRKLRQAPDEVKDQGYLAWGPAVLDSEDEGQVVHRVAYSPRLVVEQDGVTYVYVGGYDGVERQYPVDSRDSVDIDPKTGAITFSSFGKIYTIRAVEDSDGLWASSLAAEVPAEATERSIDLEVAMAFSPDAPAADESLFVTVDPDTQEVKDLIYSGSDGIYLREGKGWFKMPADDESLDGLQVIDVKPEIIEAWAKLAEDDELTLAEVKKYEDVQEGIVAAAGAACPTATQDIALNLQNRQNAIETAMYGPLNPAEPNDEYWASLASEWQVDVESAKKQRCGNCAVFIITPSMKDCIASGLTDDADEFDAIDDAGELGYCEAFDFKCAAARTCRAWVSGGPVTEEKVD
jgi:hypothetical protein